MDKKALIVSSVASMIDQFNMPNISILKEMGFEVHVACNFIDGGSIDSKRVDELKIKLDKLDVISHQIDFPRNPFNARQTFLSGKQLSKVFLNNYSLVHSHSPVGGALARIVGSKFRKTGLLSIYTAHGFHFHKKSGYLSWLFFYPIEKILSSKTDLLITINKEDFDLAIKKMKAKKTIYVPSIGVDLKSINSKTTNINQLKMELGIDPDTFVMVSVGELNNNKNHITIIRALKNVTDINFRYLICGQGPNKNILQLEVDKLELTHKVKILGYREDVIQILKHADLFLFPSLREGLGMAALEAMACGLPLITSNIHGINDYSIDGYSGFKCDPLDVDGFSRAIRKIVNMDKSLLDSIKDNNKKSVIEFDSEKVNKIMRKLYDESMVELNE